MSFDLRVADPVLTPGETQRFEIWVEFEKGSWPCKDCPKPCTIGALAYASVDLTWIQSGYTGKLSNILQSPYLPMSKPGNTDGHGRVPGIVGAQPPPDNNPFFQTQNPICIWTAEWVPSDYSPRIVEYVVEPPNKGVGYTCCQPTNTILLFDSITLIDDAASFQVIPTPGSLAEAAIAGLALAPRRRPSTRTR